MGLENDLNIIKNIKRVYKNINNHLKKKSSTVKIAKTNKDFQYYAFKDHNGESCTIQCSSAIDANSKNGFNNPGSSFLWLGIEDANPLILANNAEKNGIKKTENQGWQKYPIPEDVFFSTRMHLSRNDVKILIEIMQTWLKRGDFSNACKIPVNKKNETDNLTDKNDNQHQNINPENKSGNNFNTE